MPLLEKLVEILNPGLHRGLNTLIAFHIVGWFRPLLKQAVQVHRPINQHYFTLTL